MLYPQTSVLIRNLSQRQRTLIEEYVKEEMRDTNEENSAAAGNNL